MGVFHPEVVHFAIALLFVGVALRVISLVGRPAFIGPAAALLLLLGTAAAVAAAYTGTIAHGPIEQMPGLRPAVEAHEEWGERARDVFVAVAIIEILALLAGRTAYARYRRYLVIASAVVGLGGLAVLYEAGEHGGEIVYAYAGGVGTRSGDPQDVGHLFLAGLYQQALQDRKSGNAVEAADLLAQAARQFPNSLDVQLTAAESQLLDRKDPQAAIEQLRRIMPPPDNRSMRLRHGMLLADALDASGQHDAAIATLRQLQSAFPNFSRISQRIEQLQRGAGSTAR
ncbi:MAG TPA: tetratricopeptide repeat protein [Vicinamibacterales bacterium]|nr:tetratricopeptide repeat protein [Vicinamibacterales bacterium]